MTNPFVSSGLTSREQDAGAPQLTADQRALYRFGFSLNAATGRYEITNGLTTGTKLYLHRDPDTYRLILAASQINSIRMVRLASGRISVTSTPPARPLPELADTFEPDLMAAAGWAPWLRPSAAIGMLGRAIQGVEK